MTTTPTSVAPRENLAVRHLLQRALAKRRVPVVCNFELTLRCNLRCDHCYLGEDRRRDELSTAEVKRILDELAQAGTFLLTLTGGEVMLRRDFAEIYRHAIACGFLVTVFTNATLITPEHLELLRSLPPRSVEISLYGLNDDDYVSFTHSKVAFADVDANLRSLRDAGVSLVLKSVATVTLAPKIRAMRAYAEALGVPFRFATVVHGAHDSTTLADSERPSEVMTCELERAVTASDEARRVPLDTGLNRVFTCGAGRVLVHIDPEGFMSRCGMVTTSLAARADLRTMPVDEAWERLGVGLSDELHADHPCRDCGLRTMCNRCPATSTPEQEIAMCELAHSRARAAGRSVADLAPMRRFWHRETDSILQRRYHG